MNPEIERNLKFIEDAEKNILECIIFNIDFEMCRIKKIINDYINVEKSNSVQLITTKNELTKVFECYNNMFNIIKIILIEKQSK